MVSNFVHLSIFYKICNAGAFEIPSFKFQKSPLTRTHLTIIHPYFIFHGVLTANDRDDREETMKRAQHRAAAGRSRHKTHGVIQY